MPSFGKIASSLMLCRTAALTIALTVISSHAGPEPAAGEQLWRDAKGRSFRGSLVKAVGSVVTIRRAADGQEFGVPIRTLARSDQDRVLRWMAEHPEAMDYRFGCRCRLKGGACPELILRNDGANALSDLVLQTHFLAGEPNRPLIVPGAAVHVPTLDPGTARAVALPTEEGKPIIPRGCLVRILRAGKVVAEWESPQCPKVEWPPCASVPRLASLAPVETLAPELLVPLLLTPATGGDGFARADRTVPIGSGETANQSPRSDAPSPSQLEAIFGEP